MVEILKLGLVKILNIKFSGEANVCLRFLVEILKMNCDQDLCLNLLYDLKKVLWHDELNPRVRCAFGNVFILCSFTFSLLVIEVRLMKPRVDK